jgi:hypothetical protein
MATKARHASQLPVWLFCCPIYVYHTLNTWLLRKEWCVQAEAAGYANNECRAAIRE